MAECSMGCALSIHLRQRTPERSKLCWRLDFGICAAGPWRECRGLQSHQLQPLQARMPVLADDDVIVHRNPERPGDVDDRLGRAPVRPCPWKDTQFGRARATFETSS